MKVKKVFLKKNKLVNLERHQENKENNNDQVKKEKLVKKELKGNQK